MADTDQSTQSVRRAPMIRALLQILAEKGTPVPRSEALDLLEPRVEFSAYELAPRSITSDEPRWRSHISWNSTDLRAVGWIEKTRDGWLITDEGRRALGTYPDDGTGMDIDASRAYREQRRQARETATNKPQYFTILTAALELLEPGYWTTYGELADLASTNAQTVGNFMQDTDVEGAHRVLQKGGNPSAEFAWGDNRTETQREALEAEGVEFDESGAASEAQHMRTEDFRAYLEDKGVLTPAAKRAWLIRGSSVDGRNLVPLWLEEGYCSLRAARLLEVEPGISRDDLKEVVNNQYSQASYAAKAARVDEFHAFLSRMQTGDIVVTTSGGELFLGTITGEAEYRRSEGNLSNLRRAVTWTPTGIDYAELPGEVKTRLQIQYDVVEMTQQLEVLEKLLVSDEGEAISDPETTRVPIDQPLALPPATEELAEKLHVDLAWLNECINLLDDRPQLIFYGPPGTGKTYIAHHLAEHLAGDNVRLVQFHPSYSYEDFFEGYRPNESGGFSLKPGPLRKAVEKARENPTVPYVLIIDEINRGNLAKVFGELYFLLEYRDRTVDLLYSDETGFDLPKNVLLIGTMNTADRSIALVDAAMRRRFSFVALHPSEPPTSQILRRWITATERNAHVADLHDELNSLIHDSDFKIGPSYFMRPAVHEPGGLERAWRTSILPLLEEHHYGDGTDVTARYGLDAIRVRVEARTRSDE